MQKFLGLLDMLDGGGAGRAGQSFEGGPLSGLLNALGIRPMGYMDRLETARPMPRPAPARMSPAPAPAAPAGRPAMTPEQILAAISRGAAPPPPMPSLYDMWVRDQIMRGQSAAAGLSMGMNYPSGGR